MRRRDMESVLMIRQKSACSIQSPALIVSAGSGTRAFWPGNILVTKGYIYNIISCVKR